jgi:hypothetical protein
VFVEVLFQCVNHKCTWRVQRASSNRNFLFVNTVYRWYIRECEGHASHKLLFIYQKGPEFMGIKVCNNLPGNIELLSNNKKVFRNALLLFLQFHSFYSVEEFLLQRYE